MLGVQHWDPTTVVYGEHRHAGVIMPYAGGQTAFLGLLLLFGTVLLTWCIFNTTAFLFVMHHEKWIQVHAKIIDIGW